MPDQKKTHSQALPDSLRKQLRQFRGRVWRIKVLEAVLAGLFGLLLSYILVYACDRLFPTPGWLRLLILALGVSLSAIFAPLWINRWVFKHRRESELAHLIAKQYPRLGDRLLGVVELENQDANDTSLSPRLREAAMQEVASEVKDRDLHNALPKSWHKKWSLAVLAIAGLILLAYTLTPKASYNAMQRWLMPLAEIERYTETKIDFSNLPQPYHVAHGEPFTVELKLTEDSNTPAQAKAREGVKPWTFSSLNQRSYNFDFPQILKKQEVELRVGDAFVTLEVTPIMRPTLEEITAKVSYPDYLQKDDERIDITSGQATIVEGSEVTIIARANRELQHAQASLLDPSKNAKSRIAHQVQGSTFSLSPLTIEQDKTQLELNWTDAFTLNNLVPTQLSIEKQVDSPPSAYLQNIANEVYVLADGAIEFDVIADDDFGIKLAGLEWVGSFTKPSPHTPARGSLDLIQGSPTLRNASEPMIFAFKAYDIRPQKLIMRAWAQDYHKDHKRSYSAPITVYVLTKEEHRELIEQKTQSAINKLEDLMRAEQDALDENRRLERKDGQELQNQENREKLADQAQRENENADAMDELAKEMQDIFKEASKNGEIDPSTMKKLAESALEMKQMAEQQMPDISKKLNDAQSPENTPERSKQDVQEAVEKQSELLKQMEETIAKANEANKQLEAGTFVNRLRKAASDQEELANSIIEITTKEVVGGEFDDVDPREQRSLINFYAMQEQTSSDLRWIQEDLGHFFSRTQQQEHKDLLDKMADSNIDADMERLLHNIEQNHNNISLNQAKNHAEILRNWASELQDANAKQQGGGGGGGGGGSNSEDRDIEFMIKVLELVQKQQNIRGTNRSLEQKRRLLDKSQSQPAPTPPAPEPNIYQ
ncbi:hypothetical protein [Rubritalea tangerina]|uniref:DUF4175 family protein n=1 Tax=Rubritalea tangerina TaxID=430798 RepID=A0ABW4ZFI7_9BACT